MIYVTADNNHVVVPWQADLANLVPHAREFMYEGERKLLMPNRAIEAKLARNLGIQVPAPILTRYDWANSKPWDVQKTTAAVLCENPRCYVLSSMGVGKTRAVLYAFDYLKKSSQASMMLVAAPLSTLSPVWENEIFQLMLRYRVKVLHGPLAKRVKLLEEPLDIAIINHHGIHLMRDALVARGFDTVVLDELAVFRNKQTRLWDAATTVVNAPSVQRAWGLTGSPTPNAPTDAWAQVRLLTPARTTRTFRQFQDRTMRQVTTFRWVPKPEANELVHAAMQPSVRFTRDDVEELPPTYYVDREAPLEPDAAQAYKIMMDRMRLITASGENVTAANEGILQSKLLQVACGFLYTDKKEIYALPAHARLRAVEEVIQETDRKVIIFVPFIAAIGAVASHLMLKGHSVAMVHGSTPRGARDLIFRNFQDHNASPRILVAHPKCMSHGLTLTAANVIIWYCPTTSNETYEQANARIVRPSQTAKTLIVHMAGTTAERITYARLKVRGRMQGILLELFGDQELSL